MANHWTEEQSRVIRARNCNLLVSAAAGSGKTAVLAERILRRVTDPDHPADIDRILVVTFTKAAAGEMRERIRRSLEQELAKHPGDRNLQRQAVLVHHAKIMTIHSFCLDVIRNHFNVIGLDPVFRVAEEGELYLLRQDILSEVLEEAYAQGDPDFLDFSESFASGRTDDGLETIINTFLDYSAGFPDPSGWRRSCLEQYRPDENNGIEHLAWVQEMCSRAGRVIRERRPLLEEALEICSEADGPWMYADALSDDLQILGRLQECSSYQDYAAVFSGGIPWKRISGKRDKAVSEEKKAAVKALRDTVKDEIRSLGRDCFAMSPDSLAGLLRESGKKLEVLVKLCDLYEDRFSQAKRERAIVDFSDLEHFALDILVRFEDGREIPTETAREYADYFREIMIDEYQDSNLSQEVLLRSISGEAFGKVPNRFMVGDVKQSIYRFRLARPEIFLEKYETYSVNEGDPFLRIDLHRNFRSRPQVLELVNRVFFGIMGREIGHVEYDADAALYAGADYGDDAENSDPDAEQKFLPEFLLVHPGSPETGDTNEEDGLSEQEAEGQEEPDGETDGETDGKEDGIQELRKQQVEARAVAERIRELVGTQPVKDRETGKMRPARYGDIAVLLRTISGWGDLFSETFSACGIPAYMESGSGYFQALEIRLMLAFLTVLDDPRQDIPLAGVMHSVLGGFGDDELAQVRRDIPEGTFYKACIERAVTEDSLGKKLRDFFGRIDRYRKMVPFTPIHELVWKIADETGYGYWVRALPSGETRYANLQMLIWRAVEFEKGNGHGLFRFLRYIDHLREYEIDYPEAGPADSADAVRILSIHKSKGLEYPVVIVSGFGKAYNRQSERGALVLHPRLGAGFDLIDPENRLKYSSPVRKAIAREIREEDLGEELRVLYVAMTRAREKLILTGYVQDPEKEEERWEKAVFSRDGRLSYTGRMSSRTWLDLIMPVLLSADDPACMIRTCASSGQKELSGSGTAPEDWHTWLRPSADRCCDQEIAELSAGWREEKAFSSDVQGIPPFMSVSELKHMWMEQVEEETAGEELPAGGNREWRSVSDMPGRTMDGAQLGTLYHRVMELMDFSAVPGDGIPEFAQMQLESMVKCGKIQKDVLKNVSVERIAAFLASGTGRRVSEAARAGKLHRETPFVLGVPSSQIHSEWCADETVMIQGIIDVWFEEDHEIVLLDYKTDALPESGMDLLCRRYLMQIRYYAQALERLTGKRVKEALLYSFSLEQAAAVTEEITGE